MRKAILNVSVIQFFTFYKAYLNKNCLYVPFIEKFEKVLLS